MQEQMTVTLEVTADKEDIKSFIRMCSIMNYMCRVGTSRTIKVHVDGDGSANLSFRLIEGNKSFDLPRTMENDDGKDYSIGFGG